MQSSTPRDLPGGRDTEVAGESFYLEGLEGLARDGPMVRRAVLVPDLNNPYDRNAVCIVIDSVHVGHLDRGTAIEFRAVAERIRKLGCEVRCAARIVEGGRLDAPRLEGRSGPIFSIVLDLGTPDECLSALEAAAGPVRTVTTIARPWRDKRPRSSRATQTVSAS